MATKPESDSSDRLHRIEDTTALSNADVAIPASIRLAIASSVHLVREGLAAALRGRDRMVVTDLVDLAPVGIRKLANIEPDVVLVDLGKTDPLTAARLIKPACPGAKLVAFGLDEVEEHVFACAAAGFSGYVPRESGADELYRAVVGVADGHMHCAPHVVAAMFGQLASLLHAPDPKQFLPSLSSREREILQLVEQGRSNKQIARELAISSSTVKNHMHNILQRLQVTRRAEAAARLRAHHEKPAPGSFSQFVRLTIAYTPALLCGAGTM
jgi:two-component system, NarL family, nitrate/nitrite response regulator NarL